MRKPDWKYAPEWASWLAQDASGQWWWFQRKPELSAFEWRVKAGQAEAASDPVAGWMNTLEAAPA